MERQQPTLASKLKSLFTGKREGAASRPSTPHGNLRRFPGLRTASWQTKARCGDQCLCPKCNGIGRVTDEPIGKSLLDRSDVPATKLCPRCGGSGKDCQGHSSVLRKPT